MLKMLEENMTRKIINTEININKKIEKIENDCKNKKN